MFVPGDMRMSGSQRAMCGSRFSLSPTEERTHIERLGRKWFYPLNHHLFGPEKHESTFIWIVVCAGAGEVWTGWNG